MAIELRHIRYVVTASQFDSFRRAAASLGIKQSAISRRMRDLEDQVGVALFLRHPDGVILTHAGKKFVRHARQALKWIAPAAADIGPLGRGEEDAVKVGILSSLASGFLAQMLLTYSNLYRDVQIDILELATSWRM